MTTTIYNEALQEAQELVRMAEENAKNKLIEAFTPRIRQIIEKKIISENDENEDLLLLDELYDDESENELDDQEELKDFSDDDSVELDVSSNVDKIVINLQDDEPDSSNMMTDDQDSDLYLTNESVKTLLRLADGQGTLLDRVQSLRLELKIIGRAVDTLNEGSNSKTSLRIINQFNSVLRKSIGLKQEIHESKGSKVSESSQKEFQKLLQEIKQMTTKSLLRNLLSESKKRAIREQDEEETDLDIDVEEESDSDVDVDVDVDVDSIKSAIEQLAGAVGMEVEDSSSGDEDDADDEDEDEGDDEDMDDMDDMDDMGDLEEGDKMDDMDEMDEMKYESRSRKERVFSIDENMIRRELSRLRRRRTLRESAEDMVHHFGGGDDEGDAFEDPTELNANADDLGTVSEARKAKKDAAKAKAEAKKAKEEKLQEARKNRALKARLAEAASTVQKLNRQLAEQKLFNAKLLFVNKLMQNRGLSDKQLKTVVEALDSATTIREAKLLYTSLTESLSRTAGNLSESSTRNAGGSSRHVASGAAGNLNESAADRWSVLAGIK